MSEAFSAKNAMGEVVGEVLKALRGDRSQRALSRALGYSDNQFYRWENDHSRIAWGDFVRLMQATCPGELGRALKVIFLYRKAPKHTDLLLRHLIGRTAITLVAKKIQTAETTVRSWLSGATVPKTQDIFNVIETQTGALLPFLEELLDSESFPKRLQEFFRATDGRSVIYRYPIADALLAALQLKVYRELSKHSDAPLARRIGLSKESVRHLLELLTTAGRCEQKQGKFIVSSGKVNLAGSFGETVKLSKYWLRRSLDFLEACGDRRPEKSIGGFNVFAVSEATNTRILQLYKNFYYEVENLIDNDPEPKTEIRTMLFQLLDVTEVTRMGGGENEDTAF